MECVGYGQQRAAPSQGQSYNAHPGGQSQADTTGSSGGDGGDGSFAQGGQPGGETVTVQLGQAVNFTPDLQIASAGRLC